MSSRGGRGGGPPRGGGGPPSRGGGRGGGGRPGAVVEFVTNPNQTLADRDKFLDETQDALTKLSLPTSKTGRALTGTEAANPVRPGLGTKGTPIKLYTNHMLMTLDEKLVLFRYDIHFPAEHLKNGMREPTGKKRKRVVELLLADHFSGDKNDLASDFKAMIVSKRNLNLPKDGKVFPVIYRGEDEDMPEEAEIKDEKSRVKTYMVRLMYTQDHSISELMNSLTSTQAGDMLSDRRLEIIQSLNVVVGSDLKKNPAIESLGANKHYLLKPAEGDTWNLGAGLIAIRGYFVSVRAAASRPLLNVQVKTGAFYRAGPLNEIMHEYLTATRGDMVGLSSFVRKLSIITTHREAKKNKAGKEVHRPKTIQSLAQSNQGRDLEHPPKIAKTGAGAADVQFWAENDGKGQYVTVLSYFEKEYPKLRGKLASGPDRKGLPVVNVGNPGKPSYLPPEVCYVVAGQSVRAMLSPDQTKNMISQAIRAPAANARSIITSGIDTLGLRNGGGDTLKSFGISVDTNLVTVQGRQLPAPFVYYKKNLAGKEVIKIETRNASWNMSNIAYNGNGLGSFPPNMRKWTFLYFSNEAVDEALERDLRQLTMTGADANFAGHNLTFTRPIDGGVSLRSKDLEGSIKQWVSKNTATTPFVLVFLPKINTNQIYAAVKRVCDVAIGCNTVCVQEGKVRSQVQKGAALQYWANVDLKVNLKLGGTNQVVDPSDLGIISEGKTMVVGLDVTHPQPGSSSAAPSVAALVASTSRDLSQFPAQIRVQPARQEQIDNLAELLVPSLHRWQKRNNALPENILVCRDGVSEGQYAMVRDQELVALREACKSVYPADKTQQGFPRFTVIVVGKRHHTRFYPARERTAGDGAQVPQGGANANGIKHDNKGNTMAGTVVDRGVTEFLSWDFYLQAHAALIGTSRPAHYYVIHDDIFRREGIPASQAKKQFNNIADSLESLMYSMCYLYGRATKAVSICPPAYYADIACERARSYLSNLYDPTVRSLPGTAGTGSKSVDWVDLKRRTTLHPRVRETMFYI